MEWIPRTGGIHSFLIFYLSISIRWDSGVPK